MALQEQHDVLDFFLLHPRFLYTFNPQFTYSRDLNELVGIILYNIQSIRAELLNNTLRKFGSDALDKTAAEILLNAV